ncbi:Asp-tRNA(Asn)/Glu-tRNA(Gln) amidotransferase GatCAB subunit A [Candidatus Falkowbacteria bacterium CG10_big_fil_rev_8_21_14_0_10_39_11]|uniref:Glutamyl-tRNA(Gln) amidotransferase subunit A n=1 Tax=Candidatus Falkowbacteria bacterium CG10_big_fil_rev_8_21_14_0_10_39_11 TaxID=1974565 RepID=A0A2H0V6A2_9BACT|nr:MAG: Asp-tRNA(Asn)/Glu-tRNA(Gln) amidotransferase GatCAB subunit A [Candidatus Falkowbacteria bacterium CG10_big_fil_rev_8_21_14_0_10_39_11]
MELQNFTIKQVHEGLKNKEFTCIELTSAYLKQIKKRNNSINAFILIDEDGALTQAKKVDDKIAAGGKLNLLEGVPCAIKDNILVEGLVATGGSKILEDYTAIYDAAVISRLKAEGVVILGKTNMDEFAMGGSGETSKFGPTKNPHNIKMVPGGSSSGSAAAVADNQCVFALGSDTGGSIRQPASFCGLIGLKPTYGRVSRYGVMAMASSFDQIGPLTKSAEDSALVMNVIAGEDKHDFTSINKKDNFSKDIEKPLKGLVFGLPKEFFIKGMDKDVERTILEAINKLRDMGADVKEISLPHTKYALSTYYILMPAEVSSNLARYDGVRYGSRANAGNLDEMYIKTRSIGFGDEVKRRIMLGTYVLSAGYADDYYKRAQKLRTLITNDFIAAFKDVDAILTPTTPHSAFAIGEKFDDPLTMYLSDIFTVSANVAGLPALSFPVGDKDGLPIGLQVLGQHYQESLLLRIANQFEISH